MERLLSDGGDLDSMDRSLLDYGGGNIKPSYCANNKIMTDTNGTNSASAPLKDNGAESSSPPPPPTISIIQNEVTKHDLVVRFTPDGQPKSSIVSEATVPNKGTLVECKVNHQSLAQSQSLDNSQDGKLINKLCLFFYNLD